MSTDVQLKEVEKDGFTYFESDWNDGVFDTIKEMQQFRGLSDKKPSASRCEVWFFFNTQSRLEMAVEQLRKAGYRQIDAFRNKADAQERQLIFSVIVKTKQVLQTEHTDKMLALLNDFGVNPVCVEDLFDGTMLVTLDDQSDRGKWSKFVAMMRQANWKASRKPSVYSGDLGLCEEFRLEAIGG